MRVRAVCVAVVLVAAACGGRPEPKAEREPPPPLPPASAAAAAPAPSAARDSAAVAADLRALYDSLFAPGDTRRAVRAALGAPGDSAFVVIRGAAADASPWAAPPWEPGDTAAVWDYAAARYRVTFRVRGGEHAAQVRAAPDYPPVAAIAARFTARASAPRGFIRRGDTTEVGREFTPDSLVVLYYVRDTLRAVGARRGICGPGPYC